MTWKGRNGSDRAFGTPLSMGFLLLRAVVGLIFVVHGWEKVSTRVHDFTPMVAGLGFPRPVVFAWLAALSELLGGLSLILGVYVRLGALFLCAVMAVAILGVHWHHGLTGSGGFEFPLTLFASCFLLLLSGGGPWSLDRLWNRRPWR